MEHNKIEQKILCDVLLDNRQIINYISFFQKRCFSSDFHNDLSKLIYDKISKGELADIITLNEDINKLSSFEDVGGPKYLLEIIKSRCDDENNYSEMKFPSINNLRRIYLSVPFIHKELVKSLGAKWDNYAKIWYVPSNIDPNLFSRWFTIVEDKTNKS